MRMVAIIAWKKVLKRSSRINMSRVITEVKLQITQGNEKVSPVIPRNNSAQPWVVKAVTIPGQKPKAAVEMSVPMVSMKRGKPRMCVFTKPMVLLPIPIKSAHRSILNC